MPMIFVSPVNAALALLRQNQPTAAADLLYAEYEKNTARTELVRVANMIRPCQMFPEAVDALQRMSSELN